MMDDAGVVDALVPLLPHLETRCGDFGAGYLRLLAHPHAGVRSTVRAGALAFQL